MANFIPVLIGFKWYSRECFDRTLTCHKCGFSRLIKEKLVGINKNLSPRYAAGKDMGCVCTGEASR